MAIAHADVVRDSAESYLGYLADVVSSGTLGEHGQAAAGALTESIRRALANAGNVRLEDVQFSSLLLGRCTPDERVALINQWSLGVGNDSASVLVMGTEHAYDVAGDPVGLALESCASALLWLHDNGPELAGWIAHDPRWVRETARAYHRHPSDHYEVGSGHTWRTVARVLNVSLSDLGERAYQVERSAHPARGSCGGGRSADARTSRLSVALGGVLS
jgi:hypothetical protein